MHRQSWCVWAQGNPLRWVSSSFFPSSVGFKLSHFQSKNLCPATVICSLAPQHTVCGHVGGCTGAPGAWILPVGRVLLCTSGEWVRAALAPQHCPVCGFSCSQLSLGCVPMSCSGLHILNWEQFHRALETQFWELNNNQDFSPPFSLLQTNKTPALQQLLNRLYHSPGD